MIALDKVTFGYSPEEDRISLSSRLSSGEQFRLWLTYRLVRQLIPCLIQLVAADTPVSDEGAVKENKSGGRTESVATETAVECGEGALEFLVSEIDLAQREDKLMMTFRGHALDEPAVLGLSFEAGHKIVEAFQTFSEKAGWQITGKLAETPQLATKIEKDITIH